MKKAAQPGIAQRYREHNNDQHRLYVCACCGERNKKATGKYTRVPLRYKRVSVNREKLAAAAIRQPQRSTLNEKTAQERGMSRAVAMRVVICKPHFHLPPPTLPPHRRPHRPPRLIPAWAFHFIPPHSIPLHNSSGPGARAPVGAGHAEYGGPGQGPAGYQGPTGGCSGVAEAPAAAPPLAAAAEEAAAAGGTANGCG